jgi:hypothetical protein
MKTKPLALVALVCVAAIVTGESVVMFDHLDRTTNAWRSQLRASAVRVDVGQIVMGLGRVLVRVAKS